MILLLKMYYFEYKISLNYLTNTFRLYQNLMDVKI